MVYRNVSDVVARQNDKLEHKVGICYDAKVRFEYYREDQPDNAWRPHFMVLVDRPSNREAAGFLESALMMYTTTSKYYSSNSVNRRRNDVGGAGPRQPKRAHLPHYVYIALLVK